MREALISQYSGMITFLAGALGPDYEIVLADLEKVLVIRNGYISGRQPGSPILEMAARLLQNQEYREAGWKISYQSGTASGKVLRSSTLFIMSEDGTPEGLLCINFDDNRYKELAEMVFHLCHPDSYVERNIRLSTDRTQDPETFYADMQSLTEDTIHYVIGDKETPPDNYTYEQKLEIVRQLYKNGVFSLKGAIPAVAERIAASQASMYRYLAAVKGEERG